jgi:hypothetical protein
VATHRRFVRVVTRHFDVHLELVVFYGVGQEASRSRSRSNGVMSSVTDASVSSMRIFMRRIVLRS